ncbi:unnamed protein product [Clavelina lepadiformis]|uniref:Sulfotransferase family protein n=1 Tax=Clavelina lepadiformis TaxID=159417 RepID=A0ABP0GC19_CLALP
MKVVVAGFPKTGTKSMAVALSILGYKVYDAFDHFWYHDSRWKRILIGDGCINDFKAMYENVDAVTDTPACLFWEEISKAFPDCKIVLTMRDEDSWIKSWQGQILEAQGSRIFQLIQLLSPTGWKLFRFYQLFAPMFTGGMLRHPFDIWLRSEVMDRRVFRQHQAYCLENAPKDRLLVYNVREGWEPLCWFLGKEIPNQEFPHQNKAATIITQSLRTHPSLIRMQREMLVSLSVLTGLAGYGIYSFSKGEKWTICLHIFALTKQFFLQHFSL